MALKFRRGTTAQQSGSLAFGEPFVNTTLGTLIVGGASGDIQLATAGASSTFVGASVSSSTFISGSSLKITGNAEIGGNLTLGGQLTIGDATSDTVNVVASLSSSLIPSETNAFDLGSATKIWKDLYISTGSIKFVEGTSVVKTLNAQTLNSLESATGSANSAIQNLNSFTSSIDNTIKTKLNTDAVVSGSSQIQLGSASGNIALATQTTGDYVASLVAGTGVTITNNSGENTTPTIAIGQSVATNATPTFGNLTISGTITATGDITAYYTSDKRHKNNIQPITNALSKVSKLNGVTWEWNDDVNEVTKSTPKTGLIAQEVQEVLPEVVVERENGYLGLDYSKMMGLMVEAIKEQQTQIHNLTLEIENLKKQKGL